MKKIILILVLASQNILAENNTVCFQKKAMGLPVITITKNSRGEIVSVQEVTQSALTGLLSSGKKLKRLSDKNEDQIVFDLGQNYTITSSLIITETHNEIKAELVHYDKDDGSSTEESLICN